MYCGNCYTSCPAMPLANPINDGVSIWVGGKVSNARSMPIVLETGDPLHPEQPAALARVTDAVKKLVEVYAKNAIKHERFGEWANRIGWPRFFELTGLEFTTVPHRRLQAAQKSLRATAQIQVLGHQRRR